MPKCPKCRSENIETYSYSGVLVLKCNLCGYDEGTSFEQHPTSKTSQKAKGKHSPYKTGGKNRTRK